MRRLGIAGLIGGLLLGPAVVGARRPPAPPSLPSEVAAGHCDDLDAESLVLAIEAELETLLARRQSSPGKLRFGRRKLSPAEYAETTLRPLLALARRGAKELCAALPEQFELVRLAGPGQGHFSAYYHALLRGSRQPQGPYQHPLYRRPEGELSQLPSSDILSGQLGGKQLELCYVESVATALNVHIEGSATVQLVEGGELNLTTDGHNGHPYTNPFKLARQAGLPPADQKVAPGKSRARAYFEAHPDELRAYWAKNPHFVFFKETPLRGTGKFGQLIAGRSVAIDAQRVPMGAALWLRTEVASRVEEGKVRFAPIARLALAQDTGAAIRGVGRVDLFVGSGESAQLAAALTSRPGELYLLVGKRRPGRHQTLQTSLRTSGADGLHENALANSGRLATTPLIR